MLLSALKKGITAFNRATGWGAKLVMLIVVGIILLSISWAVIDWHLERIPASAPHRERQEAGAARSATPREASQFLAAVRQQQQAREVAVTGETFAQAQQRAVDAWHVQEAQKTLRNFQGMAHDSFICATSIENKPIVSFDNGGSWWTDDGRCATREQKRRDEEAKLFSFWPTTIRVDTDMDSFWLPNEQRTCQAYPGNKGRVAVVACNAAGSHRDHNIPVKFWGGVDRGKVSDWKCRREGDEFVCKAIN